MRPRHRGRPDAQDKGLECWRLRTYSFTSFASADPGSGKGRSQEASGEEHALNEPIRATSDHDE